MPRERARDVARRRRGAAVSTASDLGVALAPLGIALIKAGLDAIEGKTSKDQAAHDTLDALLAAVPRDELLAYLTEGGVERGERAADIAERLKWPSG